MQEKGKQNLKRLVTIALLIALQIVLSRFLSIQAWSIKIGFGFIPVVIAATLFGPVDAAIVGGMADLLGTLLFPIGPYFPGFTFTAALIGVIFGLLLKNNPSFLRVAISVCCRNSCAVCLSTPFGSRYSIIIPILPSWPQGWRKSEL